MELAGATWEDIAALDGRAILAVPVGSLEQHGPHLPLNTDTRIAQAVASGLALGRADVVVAPSVPYGASGEHAGFPGTLLVGHRVVADLLIELVRSSRPAFRGVVLVSTHGGNGEGLALVAAQCRADGDDVLIWVPRPRGGDAHAGLTETSLMLAIDPAAVRLERAEPGCTESLAVILPRLRAEGVRPISSNGVLGDPTGATAHEGHALLTALVQDLGSLVSTHWPAAGDR